MEPRTFGRSLVALMRSLRALLGSLGALLALSWALLDPRVAKTIVFTMFFNDFTN